MTAGVTQVVRHHHRRTLIGDDLGRDPGREVGARHNLADGWKRARGTTTIKQTLYMALCQNRCQPVSASTSYLSGGHHS